ncbi:stage 0 sporulation family protein [Acetanaerobacterium sp. MSJ-12]|uniref:PSP1 domain-containing protein n=1 Tax=Oscillospiraceae TaxID=216572 RepID=UPI00163CB3D8|nr:MULTISPECIES: stage 0 sporulation family protein [Oscillospiraceae]MBC2872409.1 stage 0 sporulation family protein [Bittarella massiliensis (ex Durand et al. 2017)]MBU5420663.1 stage 0 sporulation family protein [Acetanaerobacterium sp. MSJ-12]
MAEVIGVRFKNVGKVYYFDPDGVQMPKGSRVIVETARGIECGQVAMANRQVADGTIVKPLKKVVRAATQEDLDKLERNRKKEKEAYAVCLKKIEKFHLDMKLIDVEYTFDGSKILFYFTADGRVDFRELVKDLASVFRTRIELRQIGVRDESKMLGGLGVCGRPFCCSTFLGEFQPVSIKMAKEQGLSLNPTKISGTCGRLMCCLKYEQKGYEEFGRLTPRPGSLVKTAEGPGVVTEANVITGRLKVSLQKDEAAPPKVFQREDVTVIRAGKARDGGRQGGHKGDKKVAE